MICEKIKGSYIKKEEDAFIQQMLTIFSDLELIIAAAQKEQNRISRSRESSLTIATNDPQAWHTILPC